MPFLSLCHASLLSLLQGLAIRCRVHAWQVSADWIHEVPKLRLNLSHRPFPFSGQPTPDFSPELAPVYFFGHFPPSLPPSYLPPPIQHCSRMPHSGLSLGSGFIPSTIQSHGPWGQAPLTSPGPFPQLNINSWIGDHQVLLYFPKS